MAPPHPLEVLDFDGRPHVEPSYADRFRVVEGRRAVGANPFVATLLGRFNAGPVAAVGTFESLAAFLAVHDPEKRRDDPSKAAEFAFRPSYGPTPRGAPSLRAVRVGDGANVPTPATRALTEDGGATVLTLTSIDRGTHVNDLRVKVAAGTAHGRKLTLQYKLNPSWVRAGDNLGPLFTLWYATGGGAATCALTITGTPGAAARLQTALTDAVAGTLPLDLDLTAPAFNTVAKLIAYLRQQAGYNVTVLATDVDLTTLPSTELDQIADQAIHGVSVAAGHTATAAIGAIVHWVAQQASRIGPIPGVTAARADNQSEQPAPTATFLPFAGGTQPAVAVTDYEAALAQLEAAELETGCLIVDTDDAAVQAAVVAWMDDQAVLGRAWRAVFGVPAGTTDAAALANAAELDRDRVTLVHQRMMDPIGGETALPPYLLAAAIGGLIGGVTAAIDIQTAVLTRKRLRAPGLLPADRRSQAQRATLLKGGVLALLERAGQVQIALGVTTSQGSDPNLGNTRVARLLSESLVVDLIRRSVRDAIEPKGVAWATDDFVAAIKSTATGVLEAWASKANPVLVAGTDTDTGERREAYDPPVVSVTNGEVLVKLSFGFAGEVDHVRVDGTIVKVSLSSEEG